MIEDKNPKAVALQFAEALTRRDYLSAYAMTSREYQEKADVNHLKQAFEYSCPLDYGEFGPIEVGETMKDWPDKKPSDILWAYVSVGGMNVEAVTVIITLEDGKLKIRHVEVGRP